MKYRLGLFAVLLSLLSLPSFAEPTISEVYAQAQAGHADKAQAMMQEVLKAHPQSAKAHFVEAELLVRQGQIPAAREQFETAQRISPALDFARPEAVQALRRAVEPQTLSLAPATVRPGLPSWIWPIAIGMLVAFLWSLLRNRSAGPVSNYPSNASGMPYGSGPGTPAYPPASSGPSLLSSLATGAAIGGGMVAGEALAHRLLDGDARESHPSRGEGLVLDAPGSGSQDTSTGGDNFGVTDADSWDGGDNSGDSW